MRNQCCCKWAPDPRLPKSELHRKSPPWEREPVIQRVTRSQRLERNSGHPMKQKSPQRRWVRVPASLQSVRYPQITFSHNIRKPHLCPENHFLQDPESLEQRGSSLSSVRTTLDRPKSAGLGCGVGTLLKPAGPAQTSPSPAVSTWAEFTFQGGGAVAGWHPHSPMKDIPW